MRFALALPPLIRLGRRLARAQVGRRARAATAAEAGLPAGGAAPQAQRMPAWAAEVRRGLRSCC